MAEFVANDALQFVARKQRDAAARDADGGVARRVAGSKGIDALFVVEHINFRHRHARRDGHFLDDIE